MDRKLTATGTVLVISALSAATLLSACSTSAKTPAASSSTGSYSAAPTGRPTTPTPRRTSTPQASPQVDLASATCGSFQSMSSANQMVIGGQWRDAHQNAMGNPMYAGLDSSGKASYLAMTIGAYCSQPGRSDVRIANLSF